MGNLKQWARDNNPNLKFEDGDVIEGIYKGYTVVPDNFNPGKEKVRYEIEIEGKVKYWSSGSGAIAMQFDSAKVGQMVSIGATGEGMKRRYAVEFLEKKV